MLFSWYIAISNEKEVRDLSLSITQYYTDSDFLWADSVDLADTSDFLLIFFLRSVSKFKFAVVGRGAREAERRLEREA